MKNKKIALLFALSLVFNAFCACGEDESSTAQKKNDSSSYETAELATDAKGGVTKQITETEPASNSTQSATTTAAANNGNTVTNNTAVTTPVQGSGNAVANQSTGQTVNNSQSANNSDNINVNANVNQSAGNNYTANQNTSSNTSGNTSSSSNTSSNTNNSSGNTSSNSSNTTQQNKVTSAPTQSQQTVVTTAAVIEDTEDIEPVTPAIQINISDSGCSATCDNSIVSIDGSTVTINKGGKYAVSGTLSNGQIVVNVPKTDKVNLHLNGASITSETSAAIYVMSADSCVLHADEGSTNYLSDTSSNALKGCIVSKDDFTIKGAGNLTVVGNKQFGIKSSNDVKIKNGNITVSSIKAAIYGEDSVRITGGNVVVTSCKDGLKASTTANAEKGFILIEDGTVDIQNASGNGIEAITYITISGGSVRVHSAKNSLKCDVQTVVPGCLTEY